jgi:molybdopterin molybdotransferase
VQTISTSSPYPLISVQEALERILGRVNPLAAMEMDFREVQGLALARDVLSSEDMPPRLRSAVDGYAVSSQSSPGSLRVLGELTAGQISGTRVDQGTAMRIMTGGLLPPGADTVVMVEDTSERDGQVHIKKGVRSGENVHQPGQDLVRGQVVLRAGTRVGAAEVGILATVGQTRVSVHPRVRLAVLATGDELVEPDLEPRLGSLRDSNRFALIAAAREAGAKVVWHRHGRDDRPTLDRLVREALEQADVLITSGGVSMGTRDLIKPLLDHLGEVHFGRIAFKPGKPLTFATVGEKLVFGLPGYPVSSLVTFEVFVRPALLKLQGFSRFQRPRVTVVLEHELRPDGSRVEYHRAIVRWVGGRLEASSTGGQSSSRLMSMIGANALLEIQPGPDSLVAGSAVPAFLTGEILD